MFSLVSRIPDGLPELRTLLEEHITQQGLSAIERGGEVAHSDPKVCRNQPLVIISNIRSSCIHFRSFFLTL